MSNKHPPFKGPKSRISIILPDNGRGFINQGCGLDKRMVPEHLGL